MQSYAIEYWSLKLYKKYPNMIKLEKLIAHPLGQLKKTRQQNDH